MDKTQLNLNKRLGGGDGGKKVVPVVAAPAPAAPARQPSTEESVPLGAAIVLSELEDLIKANFQFYAGRPIDRFEFNAFNSDNRRLTILAQTIETQKNNFTNINESAFSLDPLNITSIDGFAAYRNRIQRRLMEKGTPTQESIGFSKSKESFEKVNSISKKLNVNKNSIDEGLFTINERTYIRLPMTGDGNCMYYSILIAEYLDSVLNNLEPSIVDIRGNPYIGLGNSSEEVSKIFRQSMQGQSRNLIVRRTGRGQFGDNLDMVARKFKQDLYRSWIYREIKPKSNIRLGRGYFFKESEIDGTSATDITELLSGMRDPDNMTQIQGNPNYNNKDIDDYFNFVFNDGYSIDERNIYETAGASYPLNADRQLIKDKELIIGSKATNPEFGSTLKIWGTVAEIFFILIRFRNLRIFICDITSSSPTQEIATFNLNNYGIDTDSDEDIRTIYLLYTGIHYDVLVDTRILDRLV